MVTATSPCSNRNQVALRRPSPALLPGLPDEVAEFCLSHVPPSVLFSVCRSWRRLIYSPSFPPFFSMYALLCPSPNSIDFFNFDPISSKWNPLPPPHPPLDLMIHHPSFLSRNIPVQSLSVSGHLLLLAATTHHLLPALPRPLIFSPSSNSWRFGPPLPTPRRWCAAGALRSSVFVASGIGSFFSTDVARSVERWDLESGGGGGGGWEKVSGLKDGRFSRDAIDAVGWRGKLCMVNVKGDAPKEGLVYDLEKDEWDKMPEGMIGGWRGPVAAMDEEHMYVVDEVTGTFRRYDPERDLWQELMESSRLKGAVQMAAGGGRVCVLCAGSRREIAVVDVVASPPRLWIEPTPPGMDLLAVHVLPRINAPQS